MSTAEDRMRERRERRGTASNQQSPDMMRRNSAAARTDEMARSVSPTRSSIVAEPSFNPYAQQDPGSRPASRGPAGPQVGGFMEPIPSADIVPPSESRTRRRQAASAAAASGTSNLTGVAGTATGGGQPNLSPLRSSQSPSRAGSDRESSQPRMSRLTAKAVIRASSRDSGSERSSRMVGGGRDVYRDERGRRVERPRITKGDVHIIGEIMGASGFSTARHALFCRYRLVYDGTKSWAVVRGQEAGSTQVSSGRCSEDGFIAWEHPLDIHMTTQKLEAWPSILLMVFARDDVARKDMFVSYALCPLPNVPGAHSVDTVTWYPAETNKINVRNLFAYYVGIAPRLDDDLDDLSFLTDVRKREESGPYIASIGTGRVHLRLQMLFRNLDHVTHQMGETLYKSLENFQAGVEASRKREMLKMAAMQDYVDNKPAEESAGLKQVREGRQARFEQARQVLEARHSRDSQASGGGGPAGDISARSRSADPTRRSQAPLSGAGRREYNGIQSAPRDRIDPSALSAAGASNGGRNGDERDAERDLRASGSGAEVRSSMGGGLSAAGGGEDAEKRRQERMARRQERDAADRERRDVLRSGRLNNTSSTAPAAGTATASTPAS